MNSICVSSTIRLRQISLDDSEEIFSLIDHNRYHLRKWLPWVLNTRNAEDTKLYIRSVAAKDDHPDEIVFVMVYNEAICGLIGFRNADYYNKKIELGYWISQELQGKGIVKQCANALIEYAFINLDMNRITIRCAKGNERSKALALRLGFIFEGNERDACFLNGFFISLEVYSFLKQEWILQH
jgi:ribosomal-protein-serine acetyltransferase